jgi:DNA-binding CsgD family transcriptional regulator
VQVARATTVSAEDMDHLKGLSEARTSYDVFRIVKEVCLNSGYKKFIMLRLPDGNDAGIADLGIITNWDPELIGAYDTMSLMSDSPILKALKKSTLPYVWRFETIMSGRSEDRSRSAADLFQEFGITSGVYFHCSGPSGQRGALGFVGDRPDPSEAELMELSYFANHAYEAVCNLDVMQAKSVDTLTEREKECVYWAACGKTSSEVGTILKISDNTVNNYLASAAMKLDTANKAHTVAKAIRYGLLDDM